jgi:hypothetical protein
MLRRLAPVLVPVLWFSLIAGGAVAAKRPKKPRPACDLAYLPFTPGAQWTYAFFLTADQPPGLYVKDPETLTITVKEIRTEPAATVIALEESYRSVSVRTELRCDKNGVVVPPTSFFFFGEPGGGLALELVDLQRGADAGRELPAALKTGDELFEEMKARAVRTPTDGSDARLPAALVELERKATVGAREDVESKLGSHDATRLELELTGRANFEGQPRDKEFNMPAAKAVLWFASGVGLVRAESSVGKGWQLASFSDGTTPAVAPAAPATTAPAPPAPPAAPTAPARPTR